MRTWIAVVLLAVGCSHNASAPKSATAAPLAPGATCDQMSSHIIQVMPGGADGSSGESGKKVAAILQERCAADAWSQQARQCLFDVKDLREADTCKQYLTKAQVDAADKQMDAALPMPPAATAEKAEPAANETPPPAPAPAAAPPPPPKTRGPVKKQKEAPKRSGDPCMGGE
jgi:hypothetical protein